jgi:hypothetical protein
MDERDTSNRNAEKHLVNVYRSFIKFEKPALVRFYNDDTKLQEPAAAGVRMIEQLQKRGCSLEMAVRFSVLTLYDLVLLLGRSRTSHC